MKSLIRTALIVALVVAAAVVVPGVATADEPAEVTVVPVDDLLTHPCTGEMVHAVGSVHGVFHSTTDGGGGEHTVGQSNLAGITATGVPSGASYSVQTNGVFVTSFTASGGIVQTSVLYIRIFRLGEDGSAAGDDFTFVQRSQLVVTPSGQTVERVRESVSCN
jgi:hypothetical protein